MTCNTLLSRFSDDELVASFRDSSCSEREALVWNLEHIAELDRRHLFYDYPSLWAYLIHEHKLEWSTAERKIKIARLMSRFPGLRDRLESGALNFTLIEIALGCARREELSNTELWELMETISGMSCDRARLEIVTRYPDSFEVPHDLVRPLTAEVSLIKFAAPNSLLEKLDEIKGLLAHSHPGIQLAELIDLLASEYLERHHPEQKAKRAQERAAKKAAKSPSAPRVDADESSPAMAVSGEPSLVRADTEEPSLTTVDAHEPSLATPIHEDSESRLASAPQKHALTLRDGYRCTYVDPVTGKRCQSRFALEPDHRISWSSGGKTILANLRYLCRSHHRRVSFLEFGESARFQSFRRP